jgi:hypothetical protein
MIVELRKKQSRFSVRILRKGKLENVATPSNIKVSQDRERQRKKTLDSLTKWHSRESTTELIAGFRDPESWRNMTVKVSTWCRTWDLIEADLNTH